MPPGTLSSSAMVRPCSVGMMSGRMTRGISSRKMRSRLSATSSGGLPAVEVRGDPTGLLALDAELVEEVAGALEEVQAVAELFEFVNEPVAQRKGAGRKQPFLLREEALGGERLADRAHPSEAVVWLDGGGHGGGKPDRRAPGHGYPDRFGPRQTESSCPGARYAWNEGRSLHGTGKRQSGRHGLAAQARIFKARRTRSSAFGTSPPAL